MFIYSIAFVAVIAAAFLTVTPVPAAAQEATDTAASDTRPFVDGGIYDKPYLANLRGRLAIGGYAEMHARWAQTDGVREELGFQLRRWNIFTATQVTDLVSIAAELEFEELGDEITLEFAAIDIAVHPSLTLRAGAILTPVGRFNLAHDSPRNEFTDRPLVSTEIVGTALTEPGIGALGGFGLGRAGRLTYEVYAVNGFHDGLINDSPDGTRIPVGKKNVRDANNSPAATGRLAWSPAPGFEIGVSGHHGAWNVFVIDGESIDDRHDLTLVALDAEATIAGVVLSGEAVSAALDLPVGLEEIYAGRQSGIYLQAVRQFGQGWVATMPQSSFEVGARFDAVDFDGRLPGDSVQRVTLGLNFRPSSDAVVKLDYVRGRARDRFNTPAESAGVLFSVATYF